MKTDIHGAQAWIDWVHFLVHQKKMFSISDEDASVDTASPKYWMIKLASGVVALHFLAEVVGTAGIKAELFETPAITGDGSALAIVAMNRRRPLRTLPGVTAFYDTTVSDDGTRLAVTRAGGGNPSQPGGQARTEVEWKLETALDYIIKVTVVANGTTVTFGSNVYQV